MNHAATNQTTIEEKRTFWSRIKPTIQKVRHSLFTWSWCKALLYWLIISGGTMSELVFLAGAVWMSLNATVHPFIRMFLSEDQTRYISFLATSAYVALPELIVSLAVIVTIGHIKMFIYHRHWSEVIWTILYGVPAVFFAGLSAYTIGMSVANIDFVMPQPFVVTRALAGFLFAFTSLLYWKLGEPQDADRLRKKDSEFKQLREEKDTELAQLREEKDSALSKLQKEKEDAITKLCEEKDTLIAKLQQDNTLNLTELKDSSAVSIAKLRREKEDAIAMLQSQLDRARAESNELKYRLSESERAKANLANELTKSTEGPLQAYSQECQKWIASGVKTATVDEIVAYTGVSKRRILAAIRGNKLKTHARNHDLVVIASLVSWLEHISPNDERDTDSMPVIEQNGEPLLHLVNN